MIMNRIFLFFGIAVLMFSVVAACGDDDDDDTVDTESDVTATLSDSASDDSELDDATGTEDDAVGTETDDATGTEEDAVSTEADDATGTEDDAMGTEDDAMGTESDDAMGTEDDAMATESDDAIGTVDDATGTEDEAMGTESEDATGTEGENPFGDLGDLDEMGEDPVELGDITFTVIEHAVIDTQGLLDLEEDMQLLGLAAKIENTGDEDLEINDLTDRIELEDADGETFEVDVVATTALFTSLLVEGDMDMDESMVLEAGDEVNGVVAFQLPDDADTTDLVLLLEDEDGEEVEVELN